MVATIEHPSTPHGPLATVLTREQLIERIAEFNPTASAEFLSTFNDAALALYLEHLHAKLRDADPTTPWVRPGDTPGIWWREARDVA